MRDRIGQAMKEAMKSGDKKRLGTLRLMLAAIKDRDLGIGVGGGQGASEASDSEILALLQKMIKQRRDSVETYRQGNREDLVQQELEEIKVIEGFLPKQMDDAETADAVEQVIEELGAGGLKDMGKVMGVLKERYAGQMDFGKASGLVKGKLQ